MADVFGVMLKNPKRFQLYSTDINVCSRLETCAVPNTIHISLKTVLENEYVLSGEEYVVGPLIEKEYKGVGLVSSYTLHVRRNEILWFGTSDCFIQRRMSEFNEFLSSYVLKDTTHLFHKMYSFVWDFVVIFCHSEDTLREVVRGLIAFREWEHDREHQTILLVTEHTCPMPEETCIRLKNMSDLKRILYEKDIQGRHPRRSTM